MFNDLVTLFSGMLVLFVDNVHFQQAAEISEALVEEQVDFEAMVSSRGIGLDEVRLGGRHSHVFLSSSLSGTQTRITGSLDRPISTSTLT